MNSAIILIDIQNDYFPGGRYELYQTEQAAANAKQALHFFRSNGLPVYHVQHISLQEGASFFLPGTAGAEIHQSVKPEPEEKVFVKHAPNAFFQTGLADALVSRQIGHIVVCGMMTHMCIDTSVRAARDHGLSVMLLQDACTTRDSIWGGKIIPAATVHDTFMASLHGSFAQVTPTKALLEKANKGAPLV